MTDELPDPEWHTISWREGSKGLLTKQFCRVRVHWASGDRFGLEVWLMGERPLPDHDSEAKWYISDFSPDTPLTEMADTAHQRWHIERFYQDAKTELGFDHYEGRSWIGLHRHLTLVMLTYTWLLLQDSGDENPEASGMKWFSYGDSSAQRPEPSFAVIRYVRRKVLERFQYTWFAWLFQNQVYRNLLAFA